MSLPLLEVLPLLGRDDRVVELLAALRPFADVRSPDRHLPRPAARFALSPTARDAAAAARDTEVPFAVWVTDIADYDRAPEVADTATVVVTTAADVAERADDRALRVPVPAIDGDRFRRVPPFVRARWRKTMGLPDDYIASLGMPESPALSERSALAALGMAAGAAVSSAWVLEALALGAPTVVERWTATWLGLEDGIHVVVAEPAAAAEAAAQLAADERRSAAMSRAARRVVEERYDMSRTVREVVRRLGLQRDAATDPRAMIESRLIELRTPRHALPFEHALAAIVGLEPSNPGGEP